MNVSEMAEAQGLTVRMVQDWLAAMGWKAEDRGHVDRWILDDENWFTLGRAGRELSDSVWLNEVAKNLLSHYEGRSLQALLCEWNPRMQPGWPSDAALAQCEWWVCRREEEGAPWIMHTTSIPLYREGSDVAKWRHWPCDGNGNKVRYPERDGAKL